MTLTQKSILFSVLGAFAAVALSASFVHADVRAGVALGEQGGVFVKGATVTATSTNSITASTNVGSTTLTWVLATDASTHFVKWGKGVSELAKVAIGDVISFFGKVSAQSGSTLSVQAKAVKDPAFRKATTTPAQGTIALSGTITAVNSASLIVKTGLGTTTVIPAQSATIKLKGEVVALSALAIGDKVVAKGSLNAAAGTFTADTIKVSRDNDDKDNDKDDKGKSDKDHSGKRFFGHFHGFGHFKAGKH